jgi:polysaccharide pyruvyl transferase WcaK-like protein
LKAEFPALIRHPDFTSPSDAKSTIATMDFLTGARMHATIGAYSAGVPVVPISYSRKFEGLYGGLGYPWLVNAKGMSTEAAQAYILDAYARRDELAADLRLGTPVVKAGLEAYVAELAELFAKVTH